MSEDRSKAAGTRYQDQLRHITASGYLPFSLQLHGVSDALVHIRKLKSTGVAQALAFACIGCNISRRIAEKRKSVCPTFGMCWTLMLLTFRLLNSVAENGAASWFIEGTVSMVVC